MESALHIKTKVLPGRKIEISTPDLLEGDPVDVFVVAPKHGRRKRRSALEIIQSAKGGQIFKTAEEVDRYLREERDSWDR